MDRVINTIIKRLIYTHWQFARYAVTYNTAFTDWSGRLLQFRRVDEMQIGSV